MRKIAATLVLLTCGNLLHAQILSAILQQPPSVSGTWTTLNYSCTHQGASTGTTTTCTPSTSIPSGSSAFCFGTVFNASMSSQSMTDSNGDALVAVGSAFSSTIYTVTTQLFWLAKAATTITSFTFNVGSSSYPSVTCNFATDSGSSPAIDGSTCSQNSSSGTTITCSSALTLAATDYVIGIGFTGGSGLTAGSSFTNGSSQGSGILNEYGTFSSGSLTPTIGNTSGVATSLYAQAFKP
jgi:hypothetical protein